MSSTDWYVFSFANPTRGTTYYAIVSLDSGGFGDVWAGLDNAGIPIAIKIIRPTSDPARDFVNWFTEQAICLRCLTHPHIVTTFDQFKCQDGTLVIVMDRAEGSPGPARTQCVCR